MLIALPAALYPSAWRGIARAAGTPPKRIAVVFPSSLEPCAEAMEGLRSRLSGDDLALELMDVNKETFPTEAAQEMAHKPAVIVAVGSDAVRAVLQHDSPAKIISTMTLAADRAGIPTTPGRISAGVYLDIPIQKLLAELHRVFPDRPRIGVIRNPSRGSETLSSIRGQLPGGSLEIIDCGSVEDLLPAFLAFRKRVDFVICLPDSSLYNSATARPLIMASLQNRLPILGFSPAFLRAGAAAAVYPDYRAIGQQTADLVRRCLAPGDCGGAEMPRKVDVAVNAKVLRMLGIEIHTVANPDVVVVR